MRNPFKRRRAFRASIPGQDPRMEELVDIFGSVPEGGDVVVGPDGPRYGAQFSRQDVERASNLGYEAVKSGAWAREYQEILKATRDDA